MASLDEEFARAEQFQAKKMEGAVEDLKKVNEQYQRALQKLDDYLTANPATCENHLPAPAPKKEPKLEMGTIAEHLRVHTVLRDKEMTLELIADSIMRMVQMLTPTPMESEDNEAENAAAKRHKVASPN